MNVELNKMNKMNKPTRMRQSHQCSAILKKICGADWELPAGLLLDFFIEEIGPVIYNQAIADAQARLSQRWGI